MATKKETSKAPSQGAEPVQKMTNVDKLLVQKIEKEYQSKAKLSEKDLKDIARRKEIDPEGMTNHELPVAILHTIYSKKGIDMWKAGRMEAVVEEVKEEKPKAAKRVAKEAPPKEEPPKKQVEKVTKETKTKGKKPVAPSKEEVPESIKKLAKQHEESQAKKNGRTKNPGAADGKDHTFVKINKDGTSTPISDEEGQAAMEKVLKKQMDAEAKAPKSKVGCICKDCPLNDMKKKCPKDCDDPSTCKLPKCGNKGKDRINCINRENELEGYFLGAKSSPKVKTAVKNQDPAKAIPQGKKAMPTKKESPVAPIDQKAAKMVKKNPALKPKEAPAVKTDKKKIVVTKKNGTKAIIKNPKAAAPVKKAKK